MADEHTGTKGGFHMGNVGGSVSVNAGGDIVAGDKTSNTQATTNIQRGFAGEEQKQQFQAQIEQLREALRDLKTQVEAHSSLNQEQKEEAAGEVLQHLKALKEAKEKAAAVPAGKQAPDGVATTVEKTLDEAGRVVDKFQDLAKKAGGIGQVVSEFAGRYGPLIGSLRHLFGLP